MNITKKNGILYGIIGLVAILIVVLIIILIMHFMTGDKKTDENNYDQEEIPIEQEEIKYDCDVDIVGDSKKAKAGDVLMFDINVKNINAKTGIIMFETLVDYDENVFNCEVKGDDKNIWNLTGMLDNYITLMRSDLIPNTEDQSIAKIKFKVKDNATLGSKKINFSKMKFTMDRDESFTKEDKNIEIEIVKSK